MSLPTTGLITLGIETDDERELCTANETVYTLGASCATCLPIALQSNCGEYKAASVFDNESTPIYAFLVVIWISVFVEFWKRIMTFRTFKMSVRDSPGHPRPAYVGHPSWYEQWIRKPTINENSQILEMDRIKEKSTQLLASISHEAQLPCSVRSCRNPALPGSTPTTPNNVGGQTCAKHKAWSRDERHRMCGMIIYSGVFLFYSSTPDLFFSFPYFFLSFFPSFVFLQLCRENTVVF